jgi:hypothetical protein
MLEKQEIARRLLGMGLTITQISRQLRCSRYFVQQVRDRAFAPEAPALSAVGESS